MLNDLLNAFCNLSWIIYYIPLVIIIFLLIFELFRIISVKNTFDYTLSQHESEEDSRINELGYGEVVMLGKKHGVKYYNFFRQEIEREDNISNQRMTWSITFQGLIINAMALMTIFSWESSQSIYFIRKISLFAIGFIGLEVGILSYIGIMASRTSIRGAVYSWIKRNEIWRIYPDQVPQATGQGHAFTHGTLYVENIPRLFFAMWFLFILLYTIATYYFEIHPCVKEPDVLKCIYDKRK